MRLLLRLALPLLPILVSAQPSTAQDDDFIVTAVVMPIILEDDFESE